MFSGSHSSRVVLKWQNMSKSKPWVHSIPWFSNHSFAKGSAVLHTLHPHKLHLFILILFYNTDICNQKSCQKTNKRNAIFSRIENQSINGLIISCICFYISRISTIFLTPIFKYIFISLRVEKSHQKWFKTTQSDVRKKVCKRRSAHVVL